MADTVKTKTALVTVLADNSSGAISEQDLRDVLVSIMGVYAELTVTGGTTSQTVGTAFQTLDWTDGADGSEDNADADYANDRIEVGANGDGIYQVAGCFSFSGTAATTFTLQLSVNGTEDSSVSCQAKLDASGSVLNAAFCGLVSLADGDLVTVEVKADGASKSFVLVEGQLTLHRIA